MGRHVRFRFMNDNIFHTKAFKENLRHYEEALQNGAPIYLEPEEFTDIAEYYHLHGDLSKGIEAADKALANFPGATEPLAFKARVAILIDHDADKAMAIAGTISDKQDLRSQPLCHLLPAIPVIFIQTILNRNQRILLNQFFI